MKPCDVWRTLLTVFLNCQDSDPGSQRPLPHKVLLPSDGLPVGPATRWSATCWSAKDRCPCNMLVCDLLGLDGGILPVQVIPVVHALWVRSADGGHCRLRVRTVICATGCTACGDTAACSIGTSTSFTSFPPLCSVPCVSTAHAGRGCGSRMPGSVDSDTCTVICVADCKGGRATANWWLGMLASFACDPVPCTMPSVAHAHSGCSCGTSVTSTANTEPAVPPWCAHL